MDLGWTQEYVFWSFVFSTAAYSVGKRVRAPERALSTHQAASFRSAFEKVEGISSPEWFSDFRPFIFGCSALTSHYSRATVHFVPSIYTIYISCQLFLRDVTLVRRYLLVRQHFAFLMFVRENAPEVFPKRPVSP
jgi:hypothetical protein